VDLFRRVVHRLRNLLFRARAEAEMAEEMRFHLEQRAAACAQEGMSPAEARCEAQRRFGNLASIQERARDAYGWGWLERLLKDLRLALRQLARSPGFALLAIVTLGLGVGANTAMFNVTRDIMMKPLPYADLVRLDRIYRSTPQHPRGAFSPADFLDLRRAAAGYAEVAAYSTEDASLSEPGRPAQMAAAARVTSDFFSLLGVVLQLGRDFRAGEDLPGSDRVVILSERTWRRRFDSRRDVVGRTIRIDGEPHQIVGVLPDSFNDWRHLGWVDLFRPLALGAQARADRRGARLELIGRRSPNRTRGEAGEQLAGLSERLAAEFPATNAASTWRAVPLNETFLGRDAFPAFGMLIGLSGFVLLIACSNLANFLLARAMIRARELAVRCALGASRAQLLRPLAAEALVLALAGGVAAIVVALWTTDWLSALSTGDNGDRVRFSLDWPVFGWAFAGSLVTAVAFAVAPALFAMRLDPGDSLKTGTRGSVGGRGHRRFRQALIVGQFALAMVLLAGAGLFIRGLYDLNARRSGWESRDVVAGTYLLPAATYPGPDEIAAFQRRALERLEALPGVESVSLASFPPFFDWTDSRRFVVEGRQQPERGHEPAALVNAITPRYLETFGTSVLAGRAFDQRDERSAPRVFIVNQTMARHLFGDENAVGQRLALGNAEPLQWGEIVGVVADVKPAVSDASPIVFQVYVPMAQEPQRRNELAVRASGVAPSALVDGIRATMTALDPDLPVRRLLPADDRIVRANYQLGVFRDMLVYFALLGLGLASLGISGVIARTTAQRTGEFAIRLALGARVGDVTRLVLASGVAQALAGAGLGLVGALGVSRLIAAAFPGIRTDSPGVLLGTTLLLVAVALVACWLPARRASRIDAVLALRAE
jgi:putative ABC transport system permease protein